MTGIDRAVVPETKLADYPPSHGQPRGAAKARFPESFGFNVQDRQAPRDALIDHARNNEVAAEHHIRLGIEYEIDGPLPAPDGRAPVVRVVWFIEAGEDAPQLVTQVPRRMPRT